jgi:triosephosphate isomerase (TIM)
MRKKLLLGNWKMNLTIAEAQTFASQSVSLTSIAEQHHVLLGVAPSFLALTTVKQTNPKLIVSAQNIHFEPKGAFTGEISIPMLTDIGVHWTLVGHSERRTYFNETNATCNKKNQQALAAGLTVVYCVGETLIEYEQGRTKEVVEQQLKEGLQGIEGSSLSRIIIAYEPVWSIGTGKNASEQHAQSIAQFIRTTIQALYSSSVSDATLILYGGSVKPDNIKTYLQQPDVDGALVGGASLKVESFKELLTNIIS